VPKTVAQKLLVADLSVYLAGAAERDVVALPDGAVLTDDPGAADVALLFVADRADVDARVPSYLEAVAGSRAVWIGYRKGNVVDVNRDTLAAAVTAMGWRPVTQVALDDAWSALRFRLLS
jgi:protein involved in temperature-dependent protein secretion